MNCIICIESLNCRNYCIANNNDNICQNCVKKLGIKEKEILKNNIKNVIQNIPIIHLDKYNDDFSFYDYFFR